MSDDLDALLANLTPEQRARLAARLVVGDAIGGDKVAGDKVVDPQGTVNVSADARINGVAVGVNLGRIVYGRDPEEDERRRLVWYLARLAAKLYRLPLRGLEERLDQGEGLALPQVYDWNYLRTRPMVKVDRLQRDLRRGLVELLVDNAQPLAVAERIRAGFLLGDLGDPRVPVTIDDWRRAIAQAQAGDISGYFCQITPGAYIIGSADDDPDADDNEKPQHTVTFDAPFLIARYPITNAQWRAWVEQAGGKPSYFIDDTDLNSPNQPATGMTWHMCNDLCAWLSKQLGVTVRMPTEEEWEATARSGDGRRYPWGDEWQEDRAATEEDQETRGVRYTVPVGCYPAGAAPAGALDRAIALNFCSF